MPKEGCFHLVDYKLQNYSEAVDYCKNYMNADLAQPINHQAVLKQIMPFLHDSTNNSNYQYKVI